MIHNSKGENKSKNKLKIKTFSIKIEKPTFMNSDCGKYWSHSSLFYIFKSILVSVISPWKLFLMVKISIMVFISNSRTSILCHHKACYYFNFPTLFFTSHISLAFTRTVAFIGGGSDGNIEFLNKANGDVKAGWAWP